jgi:DNA-binding NarL/FixJ family response regulator
VEKVRLVVIDGDSEYLNGLKQSLDRTDYSVVKGYSEQRACLNELGRTNPQLVMLDHCMVPLNGIALLARIRQQFDDSIKVIYSSAQPCCETAIIALSNGADGFVLKNGGDPGDQLIPVFATIMNGHQCFSSGVISREILQSNRRSLLMHAVRLIVEFRITSRELDVCRGLVDGETANDTGARLNLSPETIKTHRVSIYRKLGVRTRRQAVEKINSL